MSPNIYTEQGKNVRKTWLLMTLFFVLIILIGYFFAYYYQNSAILIFAILFSIIMNILSYWYSDKIVLKIHRAREATRQDFFDLYTVTENLAITAGLPKPKIYIIDDPAPNAFATGRNKDHAVVCVTTGLLTMLNRTELEGVISHELSHIGNRDILLSTAVVVLAGFIALLSHMFLRSLWFGGNRRNDGEAGGILMIIGIVLAILAPISATLIQLAISRKREFLADADGVLLTRYPEGLANALRKISANPMPMQTASNATAHLFISNPFALPAEARSGSEDAKAGSGRNFFSGLFNTHPPVEERINALLGHQ
jgi:heat shock protein HtpX